MQNELICGSSSQPNKSIWHVSLIPRDIGSSSPLWLDVKLRILSKIMIPPHSLDLLYIFVTHPLCKLRHSVLIYKQQPVALQGACLPWRIFNAKYVHSRNVTIQIFTLAVKRSCETWDRWCVGCTFYQMVRAPLWFTLASRNCRRLVSSNFTIWLPMCRWQTGHSSFETPITFKIHCMQKTWPQSNSMGSTKKPIQIRQLITFKQSVAAEETGIWDSSSGNNLSAVHEIVKDLWGLVNGLSGRLSSSLCLSLGSSSCGCNSSLCWLLSKPSTEISKALEVRTWCKPSEGLMAPSGDEKPLQLLNGVVAWETTAAAEMGSDCRRCFSSWSSASCLRSSSTINSCSSNCLRNRSCSKKGRWSANHLQALRAQGILSETLRDH